MNASAVRERCYHGRNVRLIGPGDEVCQVIGHDKRHLAVREHTGLWSACRTGGIEEPAGIVFRDFRRQKLTTEVLCHQVFIALLARTRIADTHHQPQ